MFSLFKGNTQPYTKHVSRTDILEEVFQPNEMPVPPVEEDFFIAVERLAQKENALLIEKQHLFNIVEELQNMLSVEMETKQQTISKLEDEISELQKKCEELANALKIPVIK